MVGYGSSASQQLHSAYLVDSQDFSRLPEWRRQLTSSSSSVRSRWLTTSAWFSRRIIVPLLLLVVIFTAYHSYRQFAASDVDASLTADQIDGSAGTGYMAQMEESTEFDVGKESDLETTGEELKRVEEEGYRKVDDVDDDESDGPADDDDDDEGEEASKPFDDTDVDEVYEPIVIETVTAVSDDDEDDDDDVDQVMTGSGVGEFDDDENSDDDYDDDDDDNDDEEIKVTDEQEKTINATLLSMLPQGNPNVPDAKMIHINSYQRSGSSFIGKLFDVYNPAFFVYEPLEMMYTALFGVQEDNVVPHNIFFDHEANYRNLSGLERTMMFWTMDRIYHCQISSFPAAMLMNMFWSKFIHFMSVGQPYVECLESTGISMKENHDTLKSCQVFLGDACANTFSTLYSKKLDFCKSVLFHNNTWLLDTPDVVWDTYRNTEYYNYRGNFQAYFDCLRPHEEVARQCAVEHLDKVCSAHNIRAIKTVRAPMELSEDFLKTYSNFRTVHLFRDPRGVTYSRMKANWSYAVFEDNKPETLARTYCRNVLNEIQKRTRLEQLYPGRMISILHDTVLDDVTTNLRYLFLDLNLNVTDEVRLFIDEQLKLARRDRWKTNLEQREIENIQRECAQIFQLTELEEFVPAPVERKAFINRRGEFLRKQQGRQRLPRS